MQNTEPKLAFLPTHRSTHLPFSRCHSCRHGVRASAPGFPLTLHSLPHHLCVLGNWDLSRRPSVPSFLPVLAWSLLIPSPPDPCNQGLSVLPAPGYLGACTPPPELSSQIPALDVRPACSEAFLTRQTSIHRLRWRKQGSPARETGGPLLPETQCCRSSLFSARAVASARSCPRVPCHRASRDTSCHLFKALCTGCPLKLTEDPFFFQI